ncbi:MAG: hypothetical protein ABIJ18_01425 [archaeon]
MTNTGKIELNASGRGTCMDCLEDLPCKCTPTKPKERVELKKQIKKIIMRLNVHHLEEPNYCLNHNQVMRKLLSLFNKKLKKQKVTIESIKCPVCTGWRVKHKKG